LLRSLLASLLACTTIGVTRAGADVIVARNTRHLSFTASLSPDAVKPGGHLTLVVDVVPKKKMHVYAPGTTYRAIAVTLNANRSLKPSNVNYPKPSIYLFAPLKERVLVYTDPFKLTMNVAVGAVPAQTKQLRVSGTLSYQACDDRVCYLPESIPLEWTLPVRR
jgi:cytochrome c biogenesis DsbD-like protein